MKTRELAEQHDNTYMTTLSPFIPYRRRDRHCKRKVSRFAGVQLERAATRPEIDNSTARRMNCHPSAKNTRRIAPVQDRGAASICLHDEVAARRDVSACKHAGRYGLEVCNLLVARDAARGILMMLSDRTSGLVIGVQPMAHQRLHHEPRIAKMPCAILLEIRPELGVEPIRPLLSLRLAYPFGLIP